jgi:large-conductance mechanosensitive channel
MTRGVDLVDLKWVIFPADEMLKQPEVAIGYGAIIASVITLLATAIIVYQIVKVLKLDRMDKK